MIETYRNIIFFNIILFTFSELPSLSSLLYYIKMCHSIFTSKVDTRVGF
jgi:hypothetical protein